MAADGGHVIEADSHSDLLREFFDFGDDLILPDKPFVPKKETVEFEPGFDDDFFMGATPSPSSSSTASSTTAGSSTSTKAPPTR
jgi:hypothetical protein